jgi:ornithine cyclodeaminase/alanine dehydrogenase-like protein (mu-crystallin family)
MTLLRFVSADELRAVIGFEDLIEPVAEAFRQSSLGEAQNGFILMLPTGDASEGDAFVKTGVLKGRDIYIVKVAPWFAANVQNELPQGGFVAVFDSKTGHTRAILADEHYLSDIRTAAAGALAAQLFAAEQVRTVAVLGTGVQAYLQVLAVHHERPFERLLIWGRDAAKAASLAKRIRGRLPNLQCEVVADVKTAVRNADVLITATLARDPLVQGEWLVPGQLVIAVGADDPSKCELDAEALLRARVIVDARETAAANGDVFHAIQAGYSLDKLVDAEIGEVLLGTVSGRLSPTDIVITKLVGIGAQDVVAAEQAVGRI